jgi:hypothetical protein
LYGDKHAEQSGYALPSLELGEYGENVSNNSSQPQPYHEIGALEFIGKIVRQKIKQPDSQHSFNNIESHDDNAEFGPQNPEGIGGTHVAAAKVSDINIKKFPAD